MSLSDVATLTFKEREAYISLLKEEIEKEKEELEAIRRKRN